MLIGHPNTTSTHPTTRTAGHNEPELAYPAEPEVVEYPDASLSTYNVDQTPAPTPSTDWQTF
jgi:hypothetical protein